MIIFSAPSGAGKTSIVQSTQDNLKLAFSISACTRKKELEVHEEDYYFISIEDFKNKISNQEFIEWKKSMRTTTMVQ